MGLWSESEFGFTPAFLRRQLVILRVHKGLGNNHLGNRAHAFLQ
jgi:hypothetical protein